VTNNIALWVGISFFFYRCFGLHWAEVNFCLDAVSARNASTLANFSPRTECALWGKIAGSWGTIPRFLDSSPFELVSSQLNFGQDRWGCFPPVLPDGPMATVNLSLSANGAECNGLQSYRYEGQSATVNFRRQ